MVIRRRQQKKPEQKQETPNDTWVGCWECSMPVQLEAPNLRTIAQASLIEPLNPEKIRTAARKPAKKRMNATSPRDAISAVFRYGGQIHAAMACLDAKRKPSWPTKGIRRVREWRALQTSPESRARPSILSLRVGGMKSRDPQQNQHAGNCSISRKLEVEMHLLTLWLLPPRRERYQGNAGVPPNATSEFIPDVPVMLIFQVRVRNSERGLKTLRL
jgi:hypothetical protein